MTRFASKPNQQFFNLLVCCFFFKFKDNLPTTWLQLKQSLRMTLATSRKVNKPIKLHSFQSRHRLTTFVGKSLLHCVGQQWTVGGIAGWRYCFFSPVSSKDSVDVLSMDEKCRYENNLKIFGNSYSALGLFKSCKVSPRASIQ